MPNARRTRFAWTTVAMKTSAYVLVALRQIAPSAVALVFMPCATMKSLPSKVTQLLSACLNFSEATEPGVDALSVSSLKREGISVYLCSPCLNEGARATPRLARAPDGRLTHQR